MLLAGVILLIVNKSCYTLSTSRQRHCTEFNRSTRYTYIQGCKYARCTHLIAATTKREWRDAKVRTTNEMIRWIICTSLHDKLSSWSDIGEPLIISQSARNSFCSTVPVMPTTFEFRAAKLGCLIAWFLISHRQLHPSCCINSSITQWYLKRTNISDEYFNISFACLHVIRNILITYSLRRVQK